MPDDAARNRELIERFYFAFARRDGEAMAGCYAPDATSSDPVFGTLTAQDAGRMWRMLTGRARTLDVELLEHRGDATSGTARWQARYEFGKQARPVVNDVRASFRFRDGRIVEHRDAFSFFAWSRQALGPAGLAAGWTPALRWLVRRQARADLARFPP